MMSRLATAGLAALAAILAGPALAGVSQDFSGCDGLKKPKDSDDGMRGEASFPAYAIAGQGGPRATLGACDRALASKNLRPEQALRRAHLLRARAAARIELGGDAAAALADLDAAEQAAAAYRGEFFFDRSMGVSIDLLRALALSQSGQNEAALALAEQAAARRPYSLEIQRVAALLRSVSGDRPGDRAIWQGLAAIDPMTRSLPERLGGNPASLAELAASDEPPALVLPPLPGIDAIIAQQGDITSLMQEWDGAVRQALTKGYAKAAAGQPDAARAWVAATRTAIDQVAAPATAGEPQGGAAPGAGLGPIIADLARGTYLDPLSRLIEARIAVGEGRLADAAAAAEAQPLRASPLTEEFYAAYAAARGDRTDLPVLPPLAAAPRRGADRVAQLAGSLLIRPESKRKLIDYEQSRPDILGAMVGAAFSLGTSLLGGVERTAGFRSTPQPDGTIKVEFTGNTTSAPVVQEMTLLRAAEVAREGGKSRFFIATRRDYERMLTQTMNGVPMERTLVGYKTELVIRLLDDDAAEPDGLDAVAVIDALGPIYYGA